MLPRLLSIGDGLELRTLTRPDAPSLYRLVDSNRKYLRRWLDFVDRYSSVVAAERFIHQFEEAGERDEALAFGIWSQGSLAGVITYDRIDHQEKWALIGFWLSEESQGKGLVTRGCKRLVEYAFQDLKLNRVEVHCAVGNVRCRAVPERLGFKEKKVIRGYEWLHDHYEDAVVYAIEGDLSTRSSGLQSSSM